jgi:rSAM/selenodomain-associated transferase 2/rSAM/selenodomain-associated transferase 1
MERKISIIIPVLNEENSIVDFLKHLQCYRKNDHEIILVDGGSSDNTVNLSYKLVDQSLNSIAGRATQMNVGAAHATNTILLFLHSDTRLPHSADLAILNSLSNHVHWGRFNIQLSGLNFVFRIIETMMNFRSKLTSIATGDQAIFINKKTFNSIKAYPNINIMEDIAISKKLRKQYSCAYLTEKVITSSRRWEKYGIIRTVSLMWLLRLLYFSGVHPNYLVKLYYRKKISTCCLIFTKNPTPGKTKTRLISAIGINGAYEVHVKLLKNTLSLTPKIKNMNFILYHTSIKNNEIINGFSKKYNLKTKIQSGKNLGDRMQHASQEQLKSYTHCIIIGTDCPELTKKYLLNAKEALSTGYDAVIGPAHDGGYVLIGFNTASKIIFSNIKWGKDTVLKETLENFKKLKLKYKILPPLHDVDTKEDLQYLKLS